MGLGSIIDLLFDWFGISCMITNNFCAYLQNRLIQTRKTGGQLYSDTSPFSIPWFGYYSWQGSLTEGKYSVQLTSSGKNTLFC